MDTTWIAKRKQIPDIVLMLSELAVISLTLHNLRIWVSIFSPL